MTYAEASRLHMELDAAYAAIAEQEAVVRAAERANTNTDTQRTLDDARGALAAQRARLTQVQVKIAAALAEHTA